MMELGEQILRLRGEKNLSQEELAGALGVSRQSVSKWENGVSVPELDKLVQMGELFGVSLDELVKGEAAKSAPAPEEARAVPDGGGRWETRKLIGVLLLCFGALTALLLLFLGGGLFALLVASPFLACGIVCLTLRRRVGLWCAWVVWLCVELYLRWGTGLRWSTILLTFSWTPQMNYIRLAIAWVMALVPVLLILCTARSFRGVWPPPFGGKPSVCLGAWAAVLGAWFLRGAAERFLWSLQPIPGPISDGLEAALFWTRTLGDWLVAALLCAALAWSLALRRERKKK